MSRMLIPQFSLRWVLGVTAVCAVFFLIAAQAKEGSAWATAVTIAVASLGMVLAVHAGMFFVVWLFSLLAPRWVRRRFDSGQSPFAGSQAGASRGVERS